ncbi:MAG TPA: hypothetical protein VHT73_02060 [Thermodesulfobacteriota bacterium]|nr:hypothetical protein [Thermodesulfobacteriota bacterium]
MYLIEKKHRVVLLLLFTLLFLVSFYKERQDKQLDENPGMSNKIILNSDVVTKVEGEFNKRLLDSIIKPPFHGVSVREDDINVFLDGDGWKNLSLTQKSGVLLQVAQIWQEARISVGDFPDKSDPQIRFYDKDSNKELASWSEQQGGIIMH